MNTVAHAQEACGIMKKAKMGAQTVATSAASEETLKPNAMTSQTKAQSRAVAGERASKTPNAVATPLPKQITWKSLMCWKTGWW